MLRKGTCNLIHHIRNANKFGVRTVVAVNQFVTDSPAEMQLVRELCLEAGAFSAVVSNHWAEGGKGAVALGDAVIDACADARRAEAAGEDDKKFK